MLNTNEISNLFDTSPSLKLLASRNRNRIIAFFLFIFDTENPSAVPEDVLLVRLADFFSEVDFEEDNEDDIPQNFEERAKRAVKIWVSDEYLTNYQNETGDVLYELSTHSYKVMNWLGTLKKRDYVGTDSKFEYIFSRIKTLVEFTNEDKEKRIKSLEKKRAEIAQEIKNLKKGDDMKVYDTHRIRSEIRDITQSAKELLTDFTEVEDNFRDITKGIYRQHAIPNKRKGDILQYTFDALDELKEKPQGKSFYAFWNYLLDRTQQNEFREIIIELYEVLQLRDINFTDPFLRRMKNHLHAAGSRVYEANDKMTEKLTRIIGEKQNTERAKIKTLFQEIKNNLTKLAANNITPNIKLELEGRPQIHLLLERKVTFSPTEIPVYDQHHESNDTGLVDFEQMKKVFNHFAIDKKRLKENIQSQLIDNQQITLQEVIENTGGITEGLAEVFGYFNILKHFKYTYSETGTSDIMFDPEMRKIIRTPEIIIMKM